MVKKMVLRLIGIQMERHGINDITNLGEKDGPWTEWYFNEQMKLKGYFKNGKKDGIFNSWYKNGKKRIRRTL